MIDELKQVYLTALVENIKTPNQFLKKLLYSREEPLTTEEIRIETRSRGRYIAPFIKKDGEGLMVPGASTGGYSVAGPNIRIKRPLSVSGALFNRRVGQGLIFSPAAAQQKANVGAIIAEDMAIMEDMIVNAEEWLCAMTLRGAISYSVADEEVFTITFPRASTSNITPSVFLDDTDPALAASSFILYLQTIKEVASDDGSPAITDAICGADAADQLMSLVANGYIELSRGRDVSIGSMTFVSNFDDDGVLFLGELGGIRFWRYARTALFLDGTEVEMVRGDWIEFVSTSAAADRVMYYAAINDLDAIEENKFVGKRFAKSWRQPDPSAQMSLVHSRPMPIPRRPNANISFRAIAP